MDIDKIYDISSLRIIVKDALTCYQILGIIHSKWQPLPMKIKDYIAFPKPNGYRSLHTTVFTGDGGFYYHISELETAARFGINTVVLVNNNHSLAQEQRLFDAAYGGTQRGRARDMWMFKETNFAKLAENMGCFGIRVETPNQLRDALERAFSCGKPAVIDVVSDYKVLHPRAWS